MSDPEPGDWHGDAVLMTALRGSADGNRQAFERLYRLTNVKLLAICRRILPATHDAEEALQAAYLNIWRHADGYDAARGRPMMWLITVAHRCAIDVLRRRAAAAPTTTLDLAEDDRIQETPDQYVTTRLIDCLRMLDRRDETLLRAAFFEGATYAEIADRSTTPLGTVKSRARRALLKLAECLR